MDKSGRRFVVRFGIDVTSQLLKENRPIHKKADTSTTDFGDQPLSGSRFILAFRKTPILQYSIPPFPLPPSSGVLPQSKCPIFARLV